MLLSGWIIVLAALVLLPGLGLRSAFIAAGIAVEIVGLGLIARGQVDLERRAQALAQSVAGLGAGRPNGFRVGGPGFGGLR
jgi:hypothetical protein